MNKKIIEFSDKDFKEKIFKLNKPILVDFFANWCNPCKIISEILEEIKSEYCKKIFIGKLDIDKNKNISEKYNIKSIPTIIIFYKTKIIDTHIGLLSKRELKNFIDKNIK